MDDYGGWLHGGDVEEDLRNLVEVGVDEFDLDHGVQGSSADSQPKAKLHGRKKVLAPYVTDLINLLQFLEECQQSLQAAQSLSVLAKSMYSYTAECPQSIVESDDQACASIQQVPKPIPIRRKITETSDRQAIRDHQKMQALGLGSSAIEHKSYLNGLKELRIRIKKSAPKYTGKPPGLQECIQRAPNLRTLEFRAEEHYYAENARSGANLYCRSMYSAPCIRDTMVRRADRKPETGLVEDIIVTLYVYRGRLPSHHLNDGSRLLPKKYLIASCLGRNTVEDIVNLIQCPLESVLANETGSDVDKELSEQSWKTERLVYIEHTVFTDAVELETSRASYYQEWYNASDPSKEIVIEPLDSRSLLHIPVQLGYPYLYKHGPAGCEHWLVFTDARLLHVDDEWDVSKYPRTVMRQIPRSPACSVCGKNQPRWHISNSERFPTVRSFLCAGCNALFNYDQAGNQIEEKAVITALPPNPAASIENDVNTGELALDDDAGNV